VGLSWALNANFKNVKKIARVKTMFNQPVSNLNHLQPKFSRVRNYFSIIAFYSFTCELSKPIVLEAINFKLFSKYRNA